MKTKLVLLAFLALTFLLLSGCDLDLTNRPTETPESSPTPTPTETPMPTATATPEPTATPKPAWQQTIETQDLQDKFFKVIDGKPVIDLYDTQTPESIGLNLESIKIAVTTDGLNPNILTANDADGNQYAFNPDYGWFKVPEVQMNYANLSKYTEVEQSFIEDGRANITTALKYAENPTISPNAIDPVYWVGYNPFKQILALDLNACTGPGYAYKKYPEEYQKMRYNADTKPFAWTGFYKVHLDNGKTIYVVSRTLKNPAETDKDQTINLFYGFDKANYENMAYNLLGDNITSELKLALDGIDRGGFDMVAILAPSEPYPFNPNTVSFKGHPNPVVGSLQQRNLLISLFDQDNQQIIMRMLQEGQQAPTAPLIKSLPVKLSKYILLTTFGSN